MDFATVIRRIEAAGPRHRLDIGDPDLPPPPELLEALGRVGDMRYGPPEGLQAFREAVASIFGVDPGEVVAVAGGRHGLAALMWIFRKRRLLTTRPYYPGYFEIANVFDIPLGFVETGDGWVPQFAERGVYVVNYPNNPTGAVLPRHKVKELVDVAEFIISDEIYRDISFVEFTSPLELSPNVAVVYSFSKVFSVPGLRLGVVIAPRDVAREVARFNKATINVPPTHAQRAIASVIDILPKRREEVSAAYRRRAELAERLLRLPFVKPGGAFYLFPRVSEGCFDKALAAGVSVLPGELYGRGGHVRIALVEPEEQLAEAFSVLNEVC
ncbi:pyridoxal phosphate-dependent aminotransferase [Pyrobaculum aerophilum]|nr:MULTISPECIES: pyridoxal phosphate-dependent aminotransferase [Pyrobaculum]MCX8136911.1 pyridoxal phosphate-dependent aminotransferase [Pyrobaculum aerophilum]HII46969.1 pyridoxal phosphate-dependent aminotransferase [Pyrobaculum aerophilum]